MPDIDGLIETALVALIHDPEVPTGTRPHFLGGEVLVIRERTDAEPIVRAVIQALIPTLVGTGQENSDQMTAMSHENDGGLCWCGPACGPVAYELPNQENGSES